MEDPARSRLSSLPKISLPVMAKESWSRSLVTGAVAKAESSFYNLLRTADDARVPASQINQTYGLLIAA